MRSLSLQATHLGLEDIADDALVLPGGERRAVLEVTSVNFALQGERDQEATILGFAAFLNGLTFPLQVLVRVLPVDVAAYLEDLERRARVLAEPLANLAFDHVAFVRRLARSRTLLQRRFYVVVPVRPDVTSRGRRWWPFGTAPRSDTGDSSLRHQLTHRCAEVERQLGRCGLSARRLGELELARLLHACWCPELSRIQRLGPTLADCVPLVVTDRPGRTAAASSSRGNGDPATPKAMSLDHAEDARLFLRGTRSVLDLIAPAAFEIRRDFLRLDAQYCRTLVLTAYPRVVSPGWLAPLIDFAEPIELSLSLYPLDSAQMVHALGDKMVAHSSSRLFAQRSGRILDPEREVAYEDAEKLRDALQRGEERLFSVGLSLLVRAGSLAALDDLTRRVEVALGGMLAHSRVALFEQDRGFRTCLPLGQDELHVSHNLDTSSVATMFPFASSSLAMEKGVLCGIAKDNHAPVIVDPFDDSLENANLVVFAKSGAGKSYFTKLLALRNLLRGVDFLVVDPEDEYRAVCDAVGGQYLRLASTSAQHLNPFDLPPVGPDEPDPLAKHVSKLVGLLQIMLVARDARFTHDEESVLDRAIYATYAAKGITPDPSTHARPAPLLRDLHATLEEMPSAEAVSLVNRLRRYVDGSLAGLFSGPTNVALDRPFVVFNVQSLEPELRPIGIHLIAGFVWNLVRRDRRPRLLIIDEAWTLLQYPEGGKFLEDMARRARKHYLGLVTITQDVADFLGAEQGRKVLTNASLKLLMKQDSATIDPIVSAFQLSPEERRFLLGAGKGEGLFFAGGSHVALKVEASPQEHRLTTTAPRELAARAAENESRPRPGPSADGETSARRAVASR